MFYRAPNQFFGNRFKGFDSVGEGVKIDLKRCPLATLAANTVLRCRSACDCSQPCTGSLTEDAVDVVTFVQV